MLVEIKKHQFYFAMCFAFLLLEALFSNNTQAVFYILSIATLIGGVPHGALDFFILRRIFNDFLAASKFSKLIVPLLVWQGPIQVECSM